GHLVAAVVLPIEAEQFVGVGGCEAQEIVDLPVDIAAIGEMVSAPFQPGRLRRVLLLDIGGVGVALPLGCLVDHADDAAALDRRAAVGWLQMREADRQWIDRVRHGLSFQMTGAFVASSTTENVRLAVCAIGASRLPERNLMNPAPTSRSDGNMTAVPGSTAIRISSPRKSKRSAYSTPSVET